MSELDEIMDGKHRIKHMCIEGDTIAFETELNNHTWNLTPRNIETIIYCLQQELQQKENIIKEVREDLNKQITFCTNEANATTNDKYCRIAINYLKHLKDKLDKGE